VAQELGDQPDTIQIDDVDLLMRWVHKYNTDRRADGTVKKLKPGAFPLAQTDTRGFSLFLEKLMSFETCSQNALRENPLHIGIVKLEAKDFRDFQLDVEQLPEDGEIAHCEVTKYSSKTDKELTDIIRQWIIRTRNSYFPIAPA
jgi:hypothetical protein